MTTTTKLNTCGDCAFNSVGYCMRNRMAVKPINYACRQFMTPEDRAAELEAKKQERLRKEEERLNFILTGMYIQATALMQGLEYFDMQFTNKEAEADIVDFYENRHHYGIFTPNDYRHWGKAFKAAETKETPKNDK